MPKVALFKYFALIMCMLYLLTVAFTKYFFVIEHDENVIAHFLLSACAFSSTLEQDGMVSSISKPKPRLPRCLS